MFIVKVSNFLFVFVFVFGHFSNKLIVEILINYLDFVSVQLDNSCNELNALLCN